ncbi:hypothetical protein M2403_002050 [Rahnella sp. BIGb0603]|uniref:hyaluronate lyase N-terminal domain-containing protein n=1 Tax=Rahnella sp. BIGb0603 TaxID=2940612 RepID=UPI002168D48B|nr:hypothetical protein [Rahnella sp. BIGb0603]MCS3423449.1 hypothetical protein [Rahnella sp. BIGb0603]
MAASLQLKGGTAAKVAAYTPLAREVVIDTENYRLVIGDGTTVGGKPLAVSSAATWTTARTLSFTGAATGSGSVDGSTNVSIALTLGAVDLGVLP